MSSDGYQPTLDFDASELPDEGEALVVDLEGYEGPLHVLLELARRQKVDLLKLSITRLAEQYLSFVQEARRRRFSLAADYLVMAAWLAYLKSRLLLPKPERPGDKDSMPAEEMAAALAFRLMKLEAMRKAVEQLKDRPQLKREVFTRGDPEAMVVLPSKEIEASLYDLMAAYVSQRKKEAQRHYTPAHVEAYALDDARDRLRSMLPRLKAWTPLGGVAPTPHGEGGPTRASYLASTLSASLELVKDGALEARQLEAFAEIYLRSREHGFPLELTPE